MYENQTNFSEQSRVNICKAFAKISKCVLFIKVFTKKANNQYLEQTGFCVSIYFQDRFSRKFTFSQKKLRKYSMCQIFSLRENENVLLIVAKIFGETDTPGRFSGKIYQKRNFTNFR
jgi:hypothetical protein